MFITRCSKCGHSHVGGTCGLCGCEDFSALAEHEGTPPPSPEPAPPPGRAWVTDAEAQAWNGLSRTFPEGRVSRLLADRARYRAAAEEDRKMWATFRRNLRSVLMPFWLSNPMVGNEEIVDAVRRAQERIEKLEAGLLDATSDLAEALGPSAQGGMARYRALLEVQDGK